jgi:hypothetical protein
MKQLNFLAIFAFASVLAISNGVFASESAPLSVSSITHGGDWNQRGISLRHLHFWFTGPGCFIQGAPSLVPSHLLDIAYEGGVMVETTEGYRMMVPFDPILLTRHQQRYQIDDMIASTPHGVVVYQRFQQVPRDYVEVFQRPLEAGLCR